MYDILIMENIFFETNDSFALNKKSFYSYQISENFILKKIY